MGIVNDIAHIFEPNPLACGQAVLSMVCGIRVEKVIDEVGTERETTLAGMKDFLYNHGIKTADKRIPVKEKSELPRVALLSLETPKCWHWSLYFEGKFYDPEYGVLEDFPPSARRYFWELEDI